MLTVADIPRDYDDWELNLAAFWASLEGCEGGDYLRGLCQLCHDATPGHGYAYNDDHHAVLKLLVRSQMDEMRKSATGYMANAGAWDTDLVAELIELEKKLYG